jgi:long-chain acyl-CoA synthetase
MKGETVKAYIVLRPGAKLDAAELKAWCKERLAPYKVPTQFEFVNDLPKSQIGKVLRRVLRQEAVSTP